MRVSLLLRAVGLLAALSSPAFATEVVAPLVDLGNGKFAFKNMRGVESFGSSSTCNGTTDDESTFEAAYTTLNAGGGGTIVVPAGKTCRIGADVAVKAGVDLYCEPGATIKATDTSSFTLGMFSWFTAADNAGVLGCTFDLNARKGPALWTAGENINIERVRVFNGDTSEASDHNLVRYGCSSNSGGVLTSTCEFIKNRIECANTSGAKDVGVDVAGSTDDGQLIRIAGNQVVNCDSYGIKTSGNVEVETNSVTTIGTSAVAIYAGSARSGVRGNTITASGASAKGIQAAADYQVVAQNRIVMSGATSEAIRSGGAGQTFTGNVWRLTSNSGGSDTAVGLYLAGSSATVTGNGGFVSTTDAQTHVVNAQVQNTVTGNVFVNGAYCAAPSQASLTDFSNAFNFTFTANRCYNQGVCSVVALTGWLIDGGNYLAWVNSGGRCAILVGDDRGPYKAGVDHANIVGNLLHSQQAGVAGVEYANIGKTCDGGSKQLQTCTTDDTNASTGCPGATCPNCCDATNQQGVQIVGNHFLFGDGSADPAVDFSPYVTSTSGTLSNVVVSGNTFDLNATNGVGLKFPSSNQSKVKNIQVGDNSFVGNTRLQNWTPDMGFDAGSLDFYKRAAICANETTPIITSLWETIGSSTFPTRACRPGSGAYRWGALSFPDAADKEAMTSEVLPGPTTATYAVKARVIFACSSANTQVVRWIVRGRCISLGEAYDPAWCAENGTCGISESSSCTNADANALVASSWLDVPVSDGGGCNGGDTLQILLSRDGNGTTGTDSHTNDAHLQGVQLYVTRHKTAN